MPYVEKIKLLFEEIKKGHFGVKDEFFETIWVNLTTLAHRVEAKPLLDPIYDWANAHATEQREFFELTNLTRGSIEFLADNFDNGMKFLNLAHASFSDRKDEDGVAASSIIIGFIHRSTGEMDLALEYGLKGMEQLAHSGKYKMFRIIGCYFIGGIYADTGDLDEALRLFQSGLKVDYPPGLENMSARLINGIAGVHMKRKNFGLALEHYQKALDLCETTTEYTFRARGLTDLGEYYCEMGNYQEAMRYNQEALAIRQEMKILNGAVTNLMNLGHIYNKQGNYNEAIAVLMQALKQAEEIGVMIKKYQIHHLLSEIFIGMGNLSEGLAHHKAFHEIKEVVNHEDMERKVKNQVRLFQADQTKKENAIINAQKKEIEKKNMELQETINELTLERISRKAKALTFGIGVVLFIFQDRILGFALDLFASDNYFLSLLIKMGIIFSLSPINRTIEHYLLKKVIKIHKPQMVLSE